MVLMLFIVLEIFAIVYILPFLLELVYSRPFLGSFGGTFPQIWPAIVLTPKRTTLAQTRRLSRKA